MDRLMEDIIETAHNFTLNIQEHGLTLDYSAEFSVGMKAWEKVQGRLVNGKEDDIPFYVAGYSEHIEKAQKGTRVTIV